MSWYDRLGSELTVMGLVRIAVYLAMLLFGPLGASALDLHEFWDGRCKDCHGHAGSFARARLTSEKGVLVGQHPKRDMKRFLGQHEMGPANVEGIYAMLLAQVSTSPVFQEKCASCHKTAAEFARSSLIIKDGKLSGRRNGRDVAGFLVRHGGLKPEEIQAMVDTLSRVTGEVGAR